MVNEDFVFAPSSSSMKQNRKMWKQQQRLTRMRDEYYGFVTFDHLKPAVVNSWMWQSCIQKDQQDSEKSRVQERKRS